MDDVVVVVVDTLEVREAAVADKGSAKKTMKTISSNALHIKSTTKVIVKVVINANRSSQTVPPKV